jgi:hypothetical protein
MQLPEALSRSSIIIEILNTVGLGVLGIGVVVLYRALISRSKLLTESLTDIKSAYESVVSIMTKRSDEIDQRFEDEKKFRSLYLSIVEDAEAHKEKIKAWKDDELSILQAKGQLIADRLKKVEEEFKMIVVENGNLKQSVLKLESKCKFLEAQTRNLEIQVGFGNPGVRGIE